MLDIGVVMLQSLSVSCAEWTRRGSRHIVRGGEITGYPDWSGILQSLQSLQGPPGGVYYPLVSRILIHPAEWISTQRYDDVSVIGLVEIGLPTTATYEGASCWPYLSSSGWY